MKYYQVRFRISAPDALQQDVRDVLAALAGDCGFETFEDTDEGLAGYVQRHLHDATALDQLLAHFPFTEEQGVRISHESSETPDRDWNEQWEQAGFEPIGVGTQLVIHDGRHTPRPTDGSPAPLAIEIEARQAFGTGNHATTRMMCQALLDMDLHGKTVLDCGTGTGILAIVALKRGAAEATGYDIDEWSVENARHNARLNGVEQRFTAILGDATVIAQLQRQVDVVVANINRNILLADLPAMHQAMKPNGTLLLSGFYKADVKPLADKAHETGLRLTAEKEEEGWVCLQFDNK